MVYCQFVFAIDLFGLLATCCVCQQCVCLRGVTCSGLVIGNDGCRCGLFYFCQGLRILNVWLCWVASFGPLNCI